MEASERESPAPDAGTEHAPSVERLEKMALAIGPSLLVLLVVFLQRGPGVASPERPRSTAEPSAVYVARAEPAPQHPIDAGKPETAKPETAKLVPEISPPAAPAQALVPVAPVAPPPGEVATVSSRTPEPTPAPTPPAECAPASSRTQVTASIEGTIEVELVLRASSEVQALAWYLNSSSHSLLAARPTLEAYATTSDKDGRAALRIRGFTERDEDMLAKIRATADPIGGGPFAGARWVEPQAR